MARYAPTQQGLEQMLTASRTPLPAEGLERLWAFHQLLHARNDDGDLTRLRAFETMVSLHYVDCLLVAQKIGAKLRALTNPLLDIGTGAGFPGMPIKIALPDVPVILCEMRAKRVTFLDEAIATVGLPGIHSHHLTVGQSFPQAVGGIITRAFEKIPVTLHRARRIVPAGGLAVFCKGPNCQEEIDAAVSQMAAGWQLEDDLSYRIPLTTHDRRLVVFRRLEDPRDVVQRRPRQVTSASNESFKVWQDLLTGKGIRKHGLALLAGNKLVPEVLRDLPHVCAELLLAEGHETLPADTPADLAVSVLPRKLLAELDVSGTGGPIVVVRAPKPQIWDGSVQGCVLAVPFQDPENVGAVLRTAGALGVQEVVLLRDAASPFHPKALRAGGLAALRLTLLSGGSLAEAAALVAEQGGQLVALSAEGTPLPTFAFPADFLLLPGQEGGGLPPDLRHNAVAIPMKEGHESLNGAAATAIALYAWLAQDS